MSVSTEYVTALLPQNSENKPLHVSPPPNISPPKFVTQEILCLYLEIALKYKVEQSKNGKFPSNYKASPIEFQTQIFLHR